MRCSLPDFDPAKWDPRADPEAAAEAERFASDLVISASSQGARLDHELDTHGCPWGWANARFPSDLLRYVGRRTRDDPRRSLSLRMERALRQGTATDRLIDAVDSFANHEDGALRLCQLAIED